MKTTILIILSFFFLHTNAISNDISKVNDLKKEAEKAFKSKNYEAAISSYAQLLDSLGVEDDAARLNMAHAQFEMQDHEEALKSYQKLILSEDEKIKSLAYQQLGNLSSSPKDLKKALSYFKASIKADPTNEPARYNYEMVKKKLENQQDQDQDQEGDQNQENEDQENENQENKENENQEGKGENQDQQNQEDQENSEQNQDQEGEKGEEQSEQEKQQQEGEKGEEQDEQSQQEKEQEGEEGEEEQQQSPGEESEEEQEGDEQQSMPSTQQKLEEMNISEEKAKMILEALKNSEVQYIQQNRRRSTKQQDTGKPDW